ncbi:Aldo/keto reductase [Conidiobolus coronatus NRRL 28638]|uniref:Aldo/keto reductase n=1 Tax=Conidiobolus coronatus (strain ATCC 28846 / CBS 209.66 / NRRL 28638) TaxID=796925 RepID=A0A137NUV4_CONC2|nr:Aldo/keto reductase [Conidiobolus coronatus NRRL 28638]|eukprot:KXN66560.1 Aldo/keto reductase [Conidiobolus coronatus NRRL 28638]
MAKRFILHNNIPIPTLGFGTYLMRDAEVLNACIKTAVKNGYCLIDTATVYRNEHIIGETLQEIFNNPQEFNNIKRENLFITSKLSPIDQGFEACYNAVIKSLSQLKLDYLDCYLIHWPGTSKLQLGDSKNPENRDGSWRALEKLYEEGKLKSIGVSNYQLHHLQELCNNCSIKPHVIQSEMHPWYFQPELLDYCATEKIFFQAYSSLGTGALISNPRYQAPLKALSDKYQVTVAQILLNWAIQKGVGVIPKSANLDRVAENCKIFGFELNQEDMKTLDNFNASSQTKFCWDSKDVL